MIHRVATFRFRADASKKARDRLPVAMEALLKSTPGLVEFAHGLDASAKGMSGDHVLWMCFVDRAALDAFHDAPAHVRFTEEFVGPVAQHLTLAEFESGLIRPSEALTT